ncbi:hypothetical protein DM2_2278 [Halorubrum sp. DM2]|uniref:hypothetical protein n=1 Tax=Halorubrum sp. DM2 TaxID=2527867 RepID=UPI0024B70EC4|nr:hypothetical protein [Halorubrum sp. DM2]VTT86240.1 hypothetical protein DM2_2278 [Halorubrum sp. DM2]
MSEYDALLNVIAAHPGASRKELRELAGDAERAIDPDTVDDLLDDALAREDALEASGSYWVMRTGRFHPDEYGHPITNEWQNETL